MSNTLIVYSNVPEDVKAYVVPTAHVPRLLAQALVTARGTFVNGSDLSDAEHAAHSVITIALSQEEYQEDQINTAVRDDGLDRASLEEVKGFLLPHEVLLNQLPTDQANVSAVFVLGFLL